MKVPPRTVTDLYLARTGKHLDIVFDVDLGELVQGRHVVARGIMLGHPIHVPRYDPSRPRDLSQPGGDPGNCGGHFQWGQSFAPETIEERLTEPALHYEFVPGLPEQHDFDWYWML